MRKVVFIMGLMAMLVIPSFALAESTKHCKAKEARILEQIEYAKAHNNYHRVSGLENALTNVQRWCTDDKLRDDAYDEVKDKERDVAKRQQELDEAVARGKSNSKIQKLHRKLEEDKVELESAKRELEGLK